MKRRECRLVLAAIVCCVCGDVAVASQAPAQKFHRKVARRRTECRRLFHFSRHRECVSRGSKPSLDPNAELPDPFELAPGDLSRVAESLEALGFLASQVKALRCVVTVWEFDPAGLQPSMPSHVRNGVLTFSEHAGWAYRFSEVWHGVPSGDGYVLREGDDYPDFVSDGTSLFSVNTEKKLVVKRALLPEEFNGIVVKQGLPTLFHCDVERLAERYYVRLASEVGDDNNICLEIAPRFERDAVLFSRVKLDWPLHGYLPSSVEVKLPDGNSRILYAFHPGEVNVPEAEIADAIAEPQVPSTWEILYVDEPPDAHPQYFPRKNTTHPIYALSRRLLQRGRLRLLLGR